MSQVFLDLVCVLADTNSSRFNEVTKIISNYEILKATNATYKRM